MHRSSPIRSTLNTSYIRGLGMCKVCTETVHSVALWTRVTSEVWACVKYVPKQFIRKHFEHEFNRGLGMCKVCTEAIHSEALWTRVTSEVWACVKYVEAVVFHSSTLLSFYSSILLLFRSVALLCCCSSILLAGRNLASSSFGNGWPRPTSAHLGCPRPKLTSAHLGWPRPASADLDRRKFAHTTSWHNGFIYFCPGMFCRFFLAFNRLFHISCFVSLISSIFIIYTSKRKRWNQCFGARLRMWAWNSWDINHWMYFCLARFFVFKVFQAGPRF